jgi:hypothetical protein
LITGGGSPRSLGNRNPSDGRGELTRERIANAIGPIDRGSTQPREELPVDVVGIHAQA